MKDIIIAGGGLAGLINAIELSRAGLKVLVIEKKTYPFHKVCGEYVSNEVVPYLQSLGLYPEAYGPSLIRKFQFSSVSGVTAGLPLKLGGFGISRYSFDHFLYLKAKEAGAEFLLGNIVRNITFNGNFFRVTLRTGDMLSARIVIGAYGKRAGLDRELNRKFFFKRSPFIGVKYHINYEFPSDIVALHNFKGGYCGLVAVEQNKINLCYLSTRENIKISGGINEAEEKVLSKNPILKDVFTNADIVPGSREVINEISFDRKAAVENHILMSGDTAGLISPLCGNGMSMAIHSAKILSTLILQYYRPGNFDREALERDYVKHWNSYFSWRLGTGRIIQKLFGTGFSSEILAGILQFSPLFAQWVVRQTHGKPF